MLDKYVSGTTIKKPRVRLVGMDGNAHTIMGLVISGLKRVKVPKEVIDTYMKESMSGDYDNLLRVACLYADTF